MAVTGKHCPGCGASYRGSPNYCKNCGIALQGESKKEEKGQLFLYAGFDEKTGKNMKGEIRARDEEEANEKLAAEGILAEYLEEEHEEETETASGDLLKSWNIQGYSGSQRILMGIMVVVIMWGCIFVAIYCKSEFGRGRESPIFTSIPSTSEKVYSSKKMDDTVIHTVVDTALEEREYEKLAVELAKEHGLSVYARIDMRSRADSKPFRLYEVENGVASRVEQE